MGNLSDHDSDCIKPNDLLTLIPRIAAIKQNSPISVHVGDSVGYYGPHEKLLRSVKWGNMRPRWEGCQAGLVGIGSFIRNKTGGWRTFIPSVDPDTCIGCQLCWFYCPEGCIGMENNKAVIDFDYCKGCGICAHECPVKAIRMDREIKR